MTSKMNLGIFLMAVYPNKLKDYSRDCFLDYLFFPLVEDYKIVDKNGHIYCFGRELASRLFSNKSNIPRAIKKKITPTVFFNKKYISNKERCLLNNIRKRLPKLLSHSPKPKINIPDFFN